MIESEISQIRDIDGASEDNGLPGRTRVRRFVVLGLAVVTVVVAAIALTTYLRSPGQQLARAANDLNSLPGVESAQVDHEAPSRASRSAVDPSWDRVLIKLRPSATRVQVVDLIRRAAAETTSATHERVFYIETRRATTCVCDDTTDRAATVAAELLALSRVGSGRAYVYDDTSVGLDPPSDPNGALTLRMTRQALGLLQRARIAMPRRLETYNGRIQLADTVGTPAQLSAVLQRARTPLSADWRVQWLSGRRLSFDVPPGVSLAATMSQVRRLAGSLHDVGPPDEPIVARVVASSADRSAYANVAVG